MNNVIQIFVRLFLFVILLSINSCLKGTQDQSEITEYSVGLKAIITDAKKIYSTISYQDCLTWNSLTVKEEAKEYKWRQHNYTPTNGDEGIIVHLTSHCDTHKPIAILKVEENYVPIATSGIKRID
ncbi:hypothetical protein FNW02_25235 [Komarekiella sp. 'clone 1']|uniref:Uncharacterized protein n=1 Tax=Komarekiella delphini-convector SJRDD-AB1 TaxID=2593771 RepID=A0AA40VTF1_9NOST|nr:hypothetical protein [Komarekiella delphini-convector]MBD6619037.1 hypothetical protein [Komarekiella delphini-convector SJRDD-AB1]